MKQYLALIRLKHWLKNGLVFFPAAFAGTLIHGAVFLTVLRGFFSFSFLASAIYIVNDIRDAESDRAHEKKKNRPIAAGLIGVRQATAIAVVLYVLSFFLDRACAAGSWSWILLLLYLLLNLAYSLRLKNVPLIDAVILAAGFLIRVLYGGAIAGVPISAWMTLTVITMAFYLGFGKRRNEIQKYGAASRKVLRYYSKNFLDKNMYMCLTLAILFYTMWCLDSAEKSAGDTGAYSIWTVPLLLIICMKYSMDIEGDSSGDPVEVLLGDKVLLLLVALYIVSLGLLIYGGGILG
jgi:4-hydroxybenzoate polyprenyltransferase